ncbi:MAG: hypothetical protein MJ154_02050 [Candidatus Saccharibacteria bacterium]|nr:hypothetical protein [Candidatus Saccharibacteria bacterium]
MVDLTEVSRTKIAIAGNHSKDELAEKFESIRNGRRASIFVSHNIGSTDVLIAPCELIEEIADVDGESLISRIMFKLDKTAVPNITETDSKGRNIFIENVWVPFRKDYLKRNVVLPSIYDRGDHICFELDSCQGYCEYERGIRYRHDADVSFRNANMVKAKEFLMQYFADQIATASTKSAAKVLDEISMDFSELLVI